MTYGIFYDTIELMKFTELRTALNIKIEPVYFLHGTDEFLINKAIDMITKALCASDITRYDEVASAKDIAIASNTISMFGDKRAVIVRRVCELLLKEKELVSYFKNPNPNCVLILIKNSDLGKNSPPSGEFKSGVGIVIDCDPIIGTVLLKLIAKQVQENGKNITEAGASELAKYCNNNYSHINNEITKLVNCVDEPIIDASHIQSLVTKQEQETPIYEYGNMLAKGNIAEANRLLVNLRKSGTDEYAIFGGLVAQFRRLYYALVTTCENERIAKALGCSPYAIMYGRRDNRHLTNKITDIYRFALDLEYKIKSGQLGVKSAVELLQMKVLI